MKRKKMYIYMSPLYHYDKRQFETDAEAREYGATYSKSIKSDVVVLKEITKIEWKGEE